MGDTNAVNVFTRVDAGEPASAPPAVRGGPVRTTRGAVAVQVTQVATSTLKDNFETTMQAVQSVVGSAFEPKDSSSYHVDTIEVSLEVSADGKIGLFGSSVGVSGTTTLKLTLKRPSAP